MAYLVVYERCNHGWSAWSPDLPGIGVAAKTRARTKRSMRQAVKLYLTEQQTDERRRGHDTVSTAVDERSGARTGRIKLKPLKGTTFSYERVRGYTVTFEHGQKSWGALVDALPGLYAFGKTRAKVRKLIDEGIPMHLEALREVGNDPLPRGNEDWPSPRRG